MKPILYTIFIVIFCLTGCSNARQLEQKIDVQEHSFFSTDSLLHHLKILSSDEFEGRRTGTLGAEKARNYIIEKFKDLNVQPFSPNFQQPFSFTVRDKNYNGINVLGVLKGTKNPENYIVISAHYDHEGIKNDQIYNGTDDNASGVAALLAFAEYFQKYPPEHSILLAAFDAEELSLTGSKHFVTNSIVPLERIKLNINMDMISRNENNELYAVGTTSHKSLKSVIGNFKNSDNFKILTGHDGTDNLQDWTGSSDHAPFANKKIPFLYFGVEDHKDYHQPTDVFDKIHPEFYKNAVTHIISIFAALDALLF